MTHHLYKKGMLLLCILAISFQSCKEGKKDIFKEAADADPIIAGVETHLPEAPKKESENINEEGIAEISDKDSLSDVSTAFAVDKDGKYKYKLVLEKGKTYPLNTKTSSTITQKFRDKSATETSTMIENVDFKVLQSQNGYYKMEATFVSSKMIVSGGGQSVTIDATKPKPTNPMQLSGWMVQKARKGKKITFQMDENGTVSNVKGFDKILKDMRSLLQTEVKGEELEQIYQAVSQQLNGEVFKMQVEQGMVKFPKEGAKIGKTWSDKNSSGNGSTTFTLTKVENGKAYIKIGSNIPKQSDSKTEQGITGTFSASRTLNGTVILDVNSGWIDNGKLTDSTQQSESYTDGKQTQSTSITSKSITEINP